MCLFSLLSGRMEMVKRLDTIFLMILRSMRKKQFNSNRRIGGV